MRGVTHLKLAWSVTKDRAVFTAVPLRPFEKSRNSETVTSLRYTQADRGFSNPRWTERLHPHIDRFQTAKGQVVDGHVYPCFSESRKPTHEIVPRSRADRSK